MSIGEIERGQEVVWSTLHDEAGVLLGVTPEVITDWRINRIRGDGAIDAYIPLANVEVAGVPTDPRNVQRLIELFDERAAEVGGTGQRDPVVIGHVPGDSFYMLDGFHRHEIQKHRHETHLHATVEPNLTYEQVVKRRLEYAHTHPEIEFARQVEWMQSVWERTPWHETIPNVLTAFRAFQEDYAYGGTDDIDLIDSLSDETYQQICRWVAERSKDWGYTPSQIRKNLAQVESFDPELMGLVYQKQGIPPAGRLSLKHVEIITDTYAGEFDMQKAVVDIVVGKELTSAQTEILVKMLETGNPVYAEDIQEAVQSIDFLRLKALSVKPHKSSRRPNKRGSEDYGTVEGLSSSGVMEIMRNRLSEIKTNASNGDWSTADLDNALEITMVLSETLAMYSMRSTDVVTGESGDND